ncbi:SDR family NAD(P)-dependent oxidoreductase (plasmid) [Sphingomonas paeninsulae]|uniref:SDR family NAD(P)-dependent oxidoreductase n=1 Tax=Sphingomonas paeninsulae TaxID=2319844 RepID=A0A494T7E9_SPHPE|nr:SDR family NAD(P)-dependent oxidoreductase [Sphingomonas paeninsulae]AYJ85299.1 SDR family NAD(P)-dependent oxidoreductase [Sphingomonas paeninsulae]
MMSHFDRETTAKQVGETGALPGKWALITGASSGLGIETARGLAVAGCHLFLGVRNPSSASALSSALRADFGCEVRVGALDLADMDSVAAFARNVLATVNELAIFVANAGVSKTPQWHLPNGLDVRFATNHLGHFLLAKMLEKTLVRGQGRVIVLSSAAHKNRPLRLDDLQWQQRDRNDLAAYGESKTANLLFCREWQRRMGNKVTANAVLPGSALTGLQRFHGEDLIKAIGFVDADGNPNPAMKTVEQAAATSVWAAIAPELLGRSGLILEDCRLANPMDANTHPWTGFDPAVLDDDAAQSLWDASEELLTTLHPTATTATLKNS